jgi:hypothetical protein
MRMIITATVKLCCSPGSGIPRLPGSIYVNAGLPERRQIRSCYE